MDTSSNAGSAAITDARLTSPTLRARIDAALDQVREAFNQRHDATGTVRARSINFNPVHDALERAGVGVAHVAYALEIDYLDACRLVEAADVLSSRELIPIVAAIETYVAAQPVMTRPFDDFSGARSRVESLFHRLKGGTLVRRAYADRAHHPSTSQEAGANV